MEFCMWGTSAGKTNSVNHDCHLLLLFIVVATSLLTVKPQQQTHLHKYILLAVLGTKQTVSFDPRNLYMCLVDGEQKKSSSRVRSLDLLLQFLLESSSSSSSQYTSTAAQTPLLCFEGKKVVDPTIPTNSIYLCF